MGNCTKFPAVNPRVNSWLTIEVIKGGSPEAPRPATIQFACLQDGDGQAQICAYLSTNYRIRSLHWNVLSLLTPRDISAPSAASPGCPGPSQWPPQEAKLYQKWVKDTDFNSKVCPEEWSSWKPLILQINEQIILLKVVFRDLTHKNYMIFICRILSCKGRKVFLRAEPRRPQDPQRGLVFFTWAARLLIQAEQAGPEKHISHTSSSCQPSETGGKMWGSSCWYRGDKRAVCQNAANSGRVLKMVHTLISGMYYLTSPDSHH